MNEADSGLIELETIWRTPPPGWKFDDPITKMRILRGDFISLCAACRLHRVTNKIEIPANFDKIIEDQIARKSPDSFLKVRKNAVKSLGVSGKSINDKVMMLEKIWQQTGHLLVNAVIAQERGEVCRACSFNVPFTCLTCNGVYDWLRTKFSIPKLPVDHFLHVCRMGKIYNKAQVHLSEAVFIKAVPQSTIPLYPESCWKRQLLERHYARKESDEKEAV